MNFKIKMTIMKTKLFVFTTILGLLMACSKDDGPIRPDPVIQPLQKSGDTQLISFHFTGIDADGTSVEITATIDEQAGTITATMPAGTDITALEPTVEIPIKATFEPKGAQDFTTPINYTVTAEDGTSRTYSATLDIALGQKEILLLISEANPGNDLGWNEDDNLTDWEEVKLDGNGKIVELYLSNKMLIKLPSEIGQLTNLEVLRLSDNVLAELPIELGLLNKLHELTASHNEFKMIPSTIGNLSELKSLSLGLNQLEELPTEIGQLTNLEQLDLESNQLVKLPTSIGALINLKQLVLYDNELGKLPDTIGQLLSLEQLDLYNNSITSLPVAVGQLTNLKRLSLSANSLSQIPTSIGDLQNLEYLRIQDNGLLNLPVEIGQLLNLKWLYLSKNKLQSIPDEIGALANLNVLEIDDNKLAGIPKAIVNLKKLQELRLIGNDNLEFLHLDICKLDIEAGGKIDIDIVPGGVSCIDY